MVSSRAKHDCSKDEYLGSTDKQRGCKCHRFFTQAAVSQPNCSRKRDEVRHVYKSVIRNWQISTSAYVFSWDNSITVVDVLRPNKTDVLSYLDGHQKPPQRWARATVWFGATEQPWVQEFQVRNLDFVSTLIFR
jgi:hypothetical protein